MAIKEDAAHKDSERLQDALSQLKQARLVQQAFAGLGKELSLGTTQEFLRPVIETLQALFGEAYYLIQLADPKTLLPIVVEYNGPLRKARPKNYI